MHHPIHPASNKHTNGPSNDRSGNKDDDSGRYACLARSLFCRWHQFSADAPLDNLSMYAGTFPTRPHDDGLGEHDLIHLTPWLVLVW